MQYATLKEMSKRLKMNEEEVEKLVELGVIKPPAYCYPARFGDGHSIAFFPEQVEEQMKAAKSKPKPEPEPELEAPEEEDETAEAPVPEEDELKKKEKERLDMIAAEKAKKKPGKK